MSDFDPDGTGAPRIEHAIVDEQTQLQRYLADIAMADLELLPPESARRVRPGGLLEQYRAIAAAQHAAEALDPVVDLANEILRDTSEPPGRGVADFVPQASSPRFERYSVGGFVGIPQKSSEG